MGLWERVRLSLAIQSGRLVGGVAHALRLGGGTALPGLVALRIQPRLIRLLTSQLAQGVIVVTGTNGKTTTARMLSSILSGAGRSLVHNRAGSNLLRGVASALLGAASLSGRLDADAGIIEVDEAVLPLLLADVTPRVVVINNLFRDQLDRYGEVEMVLSCWRKAIRLLPASAALVLNADDPHVASLGRDAAARVVYFGLNDRSQVSPQLPHAADARSCPVCNSPLHFTAVLVGHMGDYACTACDYARPATQVAAEAVTPRGLEGSDVRVTAAGAVFDVSLGVPGLYNVYNALGASAAALAAGLGPEQVARGLESFRAVFGRVERVELDGRTVFLGLVKNPTGFNEMLRTLNSTSSAKSVVIAINDRIADGRDVSWLWDVDFELLCGNVSTVIVTGLRTEDMALRLKYAGMDVERIVLEHDPERAVAAGLAATPPGDTLYVLPTYTAMFDMRGVLERRGAVGAYWKD